MAEKVWGGKRAGAGRKPAGTKAVLIRLTEEQHKTLKDMGGSAWIGKILNSLKGHKMLDTRTLTEEQQQAFIEGWKDAGGYTDDLDESPAPWCSPWYHGNTVITVKGSTPQEWGADWWSQCKDEVEQLIKENEQ